MHVVIRKYTASPRSSSRKPDANMAAFGRDDAGHPGFRRLLLLRDDNGLATITVTEDETGTAESMGRAATWIEQHTPNHSPGEPEVIKGHTLISATR